MARPYPKGFRDDVLRVARNYEDGVTIGQIAADFGVRPMTLSKWLPAKPRGTLDHRRAACRGVEGRVRRDRRAAEDLRMDNGPEFVSQALQQFCGGKAEMTYIPPGTPWNNGHIEFFNYRLRKDWLNRNHWNTLLDARVVICDFTHAHNDRHRHSALGYRTPAGYAAACRCAHPQWRARSTESGSNNPDSNSGWTWYGDSPGVTATNSSAAKADTTGLSRVILCCDRFRGVLPRRAVAHTWNESPL